MCIRDSLCIDGSSGDFPLFINLKNSVDEVLHGCEPSRTEDNRYPSGGALHISLDTAPQGPSEKLLPGLDESDYERVEPSPSRNSESEGNAIQLIITQ